MIDNPSLDLGKYDKHLAINIENVKWTPYRLVEVGETPDVNNTYVLLNDHDAFVEYAKVSGEYPKWDLNVLNGKVY
jgi:hypothetical protein